MSAWLIAQAWGELLYLDLVGLRGFRAVQRSVVRTQTRSVTRAPEAQTACVVNAMRAALALYFKRAECLQRSAVVTRLLRRRGIDARMVIGCRVPPLEAHAWVEVSGNIVSDYQYGLEHFRIMDRW